MIAYTIYTVILVTDSGSYSGNLSTSITTEVAPIGNAVVISLLTPYYFNFTFTPSVGATGYTYSLEGPSSAISGILQVEADGPGDLATMDSLLANTLYNVTVFAGNNPTGVPFSVTTAPTRE